MVMERNRYYRTCKCNSSHCSVQIAQRRIQNWDCMHYFYRNYTDWYYCYDSMRSGSDAHISNRHCRLILSLRYHCLCPTFNQYREMVDIFLHLQIEQMFAFLSGYGIIITKQNRLHPCLRILQFLPLPSVFWLESVACVWVPCNFTLLQTQDDADDVMVHVWESCNFTLLPKLCSVFGRNLACLRTM